ncbi:HIRA-interacting protein 3-like isoform X2 [Leguminivora glycinivorella]|uniref:HIRA-interacting protein 3-like isoform X2 n=1 Tax=Leguminivora glycinivorella TaxID=1035111 RepID=UPI00200F1B58|nr:HIRA-interacting protein 3-like isoform X2 [Leguminivora glycinivorella]
MNYEAERAMNQKRLRMDGEPGHGVVQGNGLPLNYMDNGHQIPYQPYAGAYNTHYPPPDAFAAYGPPPPGGYAPQNLSYAPPAHQNYPHHQSFPPQQPQAQLHMPQSHMVQGYAPELVHKAAWAPQPHLLPPLDTQKPLDIKQLKPEIKLEPQDVHKRPHPESEMMGGDLDQPKIKIKTDIFKPDDLALRPDIDKPHDVSQKSLSLDASKPVEQKKDDGQPSIGIDKPGDKPAEACKPEGLVEGDAQRSEVKVADKSEEDRKPFSSPDLPKSGTPGKASTPGLEVSPKKRGRPKGSTNKPKPPGAPAPRAPGATPSPRGAAPRAPQPAPRPRPQGYQYAVRPFRKDFSGIQFRRRWSDDCLDSSHIPNEVYFGDVPVSTEVLFNYYDANAERERLAAQAAQIAAQKAAAAKLAAAKLQARGLISNEVTTVDSSSSDDSSGSSGSDSDDSDEDAPLKKGPGRPKGSRNSAPRTPGSGSGSGPGPGSGAGRRGRPPVPPELREPGITDMKKFCKAAGIRFDYKKLVEGCTKNKERVGKMMDLLTAAGLEGKPSLEKCKALKQAKVDKKEQEKQAKKEAKVKSKPSSNDGDGEQTPEGTRRMTRGATGVKPRQRIVISSDEEDDTPAARRTLSKLRSSVNDSDSD